jgi:hypothetical protein
VELSDVDPHTAKSLAGERGSRAHKHRPARSHVRDSGDSKLPSSPHWTVDTFETEIEARETMDLEGEFVGARGGRLVKSIA